MINICKALHKYLSKFNFPKRMLSIAKCCLSHVGTKAITVLWEVICSVLTSCTLELMLGEWDWPDMKTTPSLRQRAGQSRNGLHSGRREKFKISCFCFCFRFFLSLTIAMGTLQISVRWWQHNYTVKYSVSSYPLCACKSSLKSQLVKAAVSYVFSVISLKKKYAWINKPSNRNN